MRKMKKFLTLVMTVTLLFSSMTVNAASPSVTAKQNADYMMATNKDGAPNWFNGAYYSDRYNDLKIALGTNEKALYTHGLQYGFNESRLVTPVLDVVKYRANNPDLEKAFGNNWKLYVRHYFEYGINEGRGNFTDFDAKTYLSMYEDLQNALGNDLGLATRHYIEFGIAEGREYKWPEPVYVESEDDNKEEDDTTVEKEDAGVSSGDTSDENSGTDNEPEEILNGIVTETHEDGSYVKIEYADGKKVNRYFYTRDNVLTNHEIYDEEENLYIDRYYDEGTGNLSVELTNTYDINRTLIKSVRYDVETDHTMTFEYEYDSDGNEIKVIQYDEDGLTYIITSEYNEQGQRIKQVDRMDPEEVYRTALFTYHSNGELKSRISYYGETSKKDTERYYYENGQVKSELFYDENETLIEAFYYDADGNEITNPDSGASPAA